MANPRTIRFTLLYLTLAALSWLAIGALRAQQVYLTRGIPAALPQPIPYGGVRLGINASLEQYGDEMLAANLERMRAAGFVAVKQSFFYHEGAENDEWAASDRLVAAVTAHDLILVPLLDGDPATGFAPPADRGAFAAWTGAFANRYAGKLKYYIVWDEPNLASHWGNQPVNPAAYGALLAAAASAIRAADPDAVIVAAPLAPTTETGPNNLADALFLEALYEAGAADSFDVAAGKPYGFDTGPDDRGVTLDHLNFSRAILLREVLEKQGGGQKAVWAGNWGWNSLPAGWQGQPSLWGQSDEAAQARQTVAAFERARREWPWMGFMFLENWEPAVPADDPRRGFSVAGRATEQALRQLDQTDNVAYPGFYLARPNDPTQHYEGGWEFSPDFGADIGQSGDVAVLRFWGTGVGLRVRQADYRARLYATIDDRPANALPGDENGTALVLTAPDPAEDTITVEPIATNLSPGVHELRVVAERGWDQWALNGFSVGYRPPMPLYLPAIVGLSVASAIFLLLALRCARRADWPGLSHTAERFFARLDRRTQVRLTALAAALVALSGWLTWGQQAAGLYRRLGDAGQLALTAAAASIFYVTPTFFIYVIALAALFICVYYRPAWGLALVAFAFPFSIRPKPMLGYRFSPVEVFMAVTFAAFLLSRLTHYAHHLKNAFAKANPLRFPFHVSRFTLPDYAVLAFVLIATFSLLFTERLDVATNEWRVVVLEPVLFYGVLRWLRPAERELWAILDAFVLGGVVVALVGLGYYLTGADVITAEGGLLRLRSIYGSPNNVALYLGRIFPLLLAMVMLGSATANGRRRLAYALALVVVTPTILLTFSKGALFLGLPAAVLVILYYWRRLNGRRAWPWLLALVGLGVASFLIALQIPQLAARLDPQGATGFVRIHLWRASLNMIADHPLFGVGLDNFLYEYRGRYIFDVAWQEPDLSHPHNVLLDFATRLGLLGVAAGAGLFWAFWRTMQPLAARVSLAWRPVAVGFLGSFAAMLAHGLVDHSFFLVDLAFAFFLMLGAAVWLEQNQLPERRNE